MKERDERLTYLVGLKLNDFKSPKSEIEKQKILELGKKWMEEHEGENPNIY